MTTADRVNTAGRRRMRPTTKRSPQVRQHQTGAPRARPTTTRRGALMGIMLPAPTRRGGGA